VDNSTSKIVVITGVTRGLGHAMAAEFARLGHTVLGCARSRHAIFQMGQVLGKPHDLQTVNVASDAEVKSWANRLLNTYGAPDLLLNNAAIINRNAPLWKVGAQEFSDLIDVNIKGVANVIRHFVPNMTAMRRGVIVNFSSGWGRSTDVDVAPYCASKWAIEGLTQALAKELPPGMAAVPLNPGVVNTDMLQSSFGSSASAYLLPGEWASKAVPFLLALGPKDNGKPLTAPN
jgi:NAD(P)-dependent dehydrogenase (short-subunit alcohol dehydrogenase family)